MPIPQTVKFNLSDEYSRVLKSDADADICLHEDPDCGKNYGYFCEKGCFEIIVDLQTLLRVDGDENGMD